MFGLYLKNVDFTCRFFEAVFSDQSEIHFGQRLVRKSEYSLQFLKIVIFFFERNEPEAGFFTVRFICFKDVCRNNNNKKNAVHWFSCAQTWLCWCNYPSGLLCLLKVSSNQRCNQCFTDLLLCTHGKTEQLSTLLIISHKMLKMEFSVTYTLLKFIIEIWSSSCCHDHFPRTEFFNICFTFAGS